jgi:hypothetical protein
VRIEQVLDLRAGEIRVDDEAGFLRNVASCPAALSDRRSGGHRLCQTIALATGLPVRFSHSTVVSR